MQNTIIRETLLDVIAGKAAVCPQCKRSYKDRANAEAIEDWGKCLTCDHIEGEDAE